jgi:hypothetical protein
VFAPPGNIASTLVNPVLRPDVEHQSDCAASNCKALIDTVTEASTIRLKYLLHKFQNISFEKNMSDGGDTRHRSIGFGYLNIVTNDVNGSRSICIGALLAHSNTSSYRLLTGRHSEMP